MIRDTRPISWIKAAHRDVEYVPEGAQMDVRRALTMVAEGRHPDIAKPLRGLGSGVLELALRHRGEAYRVVYAVQLGADIWILHAFQKKSKRGIETPQIEIDLVRERLKRLKEMLR